MPSWLYNFKCDPEGVTRQLSDPLLGADGSADRVMCAWCGLVGVLIYGPEVCLVALVTRGIGDGG